MRDLSALAESAIKAAILEFNPKSLDSYETLTQRLESLEVQARAKKLPEAESILAQLWSTRIHMAFDMKRYDFVLEESGRFLEEVSDRILNFVNVSSLRILSLHALGDHEAEREELLALARNPDIDGSVLLFPLRNYVVRHPGNLSIDSQTKERLLQAIRDLGHSHFPKLLDLPDDKLETEELLLRAVDIYRESQQEARDGDM